MSKQIVYRIEDRNAKWNIVYEGPYFNNYGGSAQWKERSHNTKKHPTCDQDKQLVKEFAKLQEQTNHAFTNKDFYCGFTSLEQIKNWFTEKELWNLEMQGFVIAIYETDFLVSSPKQALFIPKKARKRKFIDYKEVK